MLSPLVVPAVEWRREEYLLSTDPLLLDIDWIHQQLSEHTYWARGQSRAMTERSLSASLPFGLYHRQQQVGFGRLVTDYSRFGWLCDVIIAQAWRGNGLASWLMHCLRQHPDLQTVRRWMLSTADAHEVYRRAGWRVVANPGHLMECPKS